MALDKDGLASAIESALRSTTPGKDSVSALANALADAIDVFVKSGIVVAHTTTGNCMISGSPHISLQVTGQVT